MLSSWTETVRHVLGMIAAEDVTDNTEIKMQMSSICRREHGGDMLQTYYQRHRRAIYTGRWDRQSVNQSTPPDFICYRSHLYWNWTNSVGLHDISWHRTHLRTLRREISHEEIDTDDTGQKRCRDNNLQKRSESPWTIQLVCWDIREAQEGCAVECGSSRAVTVMRSCSNFGMIIIISNGYSSQKTLKAYHE